MTNSRPNDSEIQMDLTEFLGKFGTNKEERSAIQIEFMSDKVSVRFEKFQDALIQLNQILTGFETQLKEINKRLQTETKKYQNNASGGSIQFDVEMLLVKLTLVEEIIKETQASYALIKERMKKGDDFAEARTKGVCANVSLPAHSFFAEAKEYRAKKNEAARVDNNDLQNKMKSI